MSKNRLKDILYVPEEEDVYCSDPSGPFLQDGRMVGRTVSELRQWMNVNNHYPNVWFVSYHGNHHLIQIEY